MGRDLGVKEIKKDMGEGERAWGKMSGGKF